MNLGDRIAVISDVHGEHRLLGEVLRHCAGNAVQSIVLLGDLFDRLDHAETCARCLSDWTVVGVLGNHEREAIEHARPSQAPVNGNLGRLLDKLTDRVFLDDAMFVHDEFELSSSPPDQPVPGIVFAGHTHYRTARDENGPIDISLGRLNLRAGRRYVINPGAVVEGQFAVWDRHESKVTFERI